jgi:hypothetical protein
MALTPSSSKEYLMETTYYVSLIGPLSGAYLPVHAPDESTLYRALANSKVKNLWGAIWNIDQPDTGAILNPIHHTELK